MAGFEVIVRPVVFPDIRPQPARSLPAEDDPEKGICRITGASGQVVDLPYSFSISKSKTRAQEIQRTVDKQRVYQKEDDGTVNKDNFVDVDTVKKLKMDQGKNKNYYPSNPTIVWKFAPPEEADNIETLERDVVKKNPDYDENK
jgi:predicted transcriptional regulator